METVNGLVFGDMSEKYVKDAGYSQVDLTLMFSLEFFFNSILTAGFVQLSRK